MKSNFIRSIISALLAGLVLAAIILAFRYDRWTQNRVVLMQHHDWKHSTVYRVSTALSRYGDWPELMAMGAVGLVIARAARSRDWQRILIAAMVSSTLAGIMVNSIRLTTGRPRPREEPQIQEGWYGPYHDGKLLIGNPKYNAFPSGHTATAIGFAAVILFARPLVGILVLGGAAAVGLSRIALGAHHLSDVTVGALIAIFVAWICWREARRNGDAIAAWVAKKFNRKP
jgi:undecaprenyl-diphosphatase